MDEAEAVHISLEQTVAPSFTSYIKMANCEMIRVSTCATRGNSASTLDAAARVQGCTSKGAAIDKQGGFVYAARGDHTTTAIAVQAGVQGSAKDCCKCCSYNFNPLYATRTQ